MMPVDVVIPALNEEYNIVNVLGPLADHPMIGDIIVVVDRQSVDKTDLVADEFATVVLCGLASGKGQSVMAGLQCVGTSHVLLCDADITGLTEDHISLITAEAIADTDTMVIGVPDIPDNYPEKRLFAWPWVSGQRCLPVKVLRPLTLHGYLMETQINQAASHAKIPVRFEPLHGVKSPYIMTEKRIQDMIRDAEWGRENGVI